ncbi:MAG: hypothetical protein SPI86_07565 [Treponemataceae bacterium]|nr:hypothetical protein [Spirochaetales bacterium]MDY6031603.1 hypothetical protein [Treponemataceae bacterium]
MVTTKELENLQNEVIDASNKILEILKTVGKYTLLVISFIILGTAGYFTAVITTSLFLLGLIPAYIGYKKKKRFC